jgi:hypothetical protein
MNFNSSDTWLVVGMLYASRLFYKVYTNVMCCRIGVGAGLRSTAGTAQRLDDLLEPRSSSTGLPLEAGGRPRCRNGRDGFEEADRLLFDRYRVRQREVVHAGVPLRDRRDRGRASRSPGWARVSEWRGGVVDLWSREELDGGLASVNPRARMRGRGSGDHGEIASRSGVREGQWRGTIFRLGRRGAAIPAWRSARGRSRRRTNKGSRV